MIERRAFVVSQESGFVWVTAKPESACNTCSLSGGCGAGALNRWLAGRQRLLKVRTDHPLQLGAKVTVGIDETALVQGSLVLYLVPLLLMLAAAVGARALAPPAWTDPIAALAAVSGLACGLGLVRTEWLASVFSHWQPRVLEVEETPVATGTASLLP